MKEPKNVERAEAVEEKAAEEKALPERDETGPVLNEDDFLMYINDEVVPAARSLGYEVSLTKLAGAVGPTMYYDPITLEGVVYEPGEEVPKQMLTGDQWRIAAQRRLRKNAG